MMYVAILIFVMAGFLLIRYIALKREVKTIHQQLHSYNQRYTNKKIDMALVDKDLEELGLEINKLMDLHMLEHRKRVKFENDQKQVIANISHDLRTPLTSILGYIQLAAADDMSEDERKKLLSTAGTRARRLESLLKDFFELSVIDSADYHLTLEQINLKHVIVDILMSFYDRFREKNMEPTILIPKNDIFIHADKSALTRVIENLLSNAIIHSDGNIVIRLEEKDERVKLTIKNDAQSLTKKDVDHIFDRFYKADSSRSGKSTGLGLSIVKHFMEKMDGTSKGLLIDGELSIICEWKAIKS